MLGLSWENGKENGNYYGLLGLYWDNEEENGNYYGISGYIWIMEKKMDPTIYDYANSEP